MKNNNGYSFDYSFDVLIDGKIVKEYYNVNDDQTYIEGRRGSNFTLRFKNNTYSSVLVVFSIDGLSVMDGKTASEKSNGYVVRSWGTLDIPGWRIDNREVAKFQFRPKGDRDDKTYVEELESEGFDVDVNNQGVIGCMVYKEKYNPPKYITNTVYIDRPVYIPNNNLCNINWGIGNDIYTRTLAQPQSMRYAAGGGGMSSSMASAPSPDLSAYACNFVGQNTVGDIAGQFCVQSAEPSLGTGFGESAKFETTTVDFERENYPTWIGSLFYDTRTNLQKKGIIFAYKATGTPQAFPGMNNKGCYIPKSRR